MDNSKPTIEQDYRNLAVIWFALFNSQIIFLVLIYFIKPEVYQLDLRKPLLGEEAIIIIVFLFVALSLFIVSFIANRHFVSQAIDKQQPMLVQIGMIVACALCEAVSLFGLILVFMQSYQYFFIWFGLGMLGMIVNFPRRQNLIDASFQNKF
jgi:hypothetical protein